MPAHRRYASNADKQAAYRQRCKAQVESESAGPPIPGYRRWEAMRRQALHLLEQVASEMEIYYDERSDAWQNSERAEAFTEVMESVAETAAALRDLQPL